MNSVLRRKKKSQNNICEFGFFKICDKKYNRPRNMLDLSNCYEIFMFPQKIEKTIIELKARQE